jgi:predicted transposase YdaD
MNKLITNVPHTKTLTMYRRMLKSMMVVFEGDFEMFHRARIELRQSIVKERDLRDQHKINDLLF